MNKELLKLAIPNILTNLSVPLVSMVDLGLMGRMPSSNFIIAIGFGTVIFNFLYWGFGFLRMGTTGMVSQAYGRNDKTKSLLLLFQGLSFSLLAGLILVLVHYPLLEIAIQIIHPDNEVISPLRTYFNYRIWAAPATISVFVLSGWLLGMQDAKSAMIIAFVVNGLNAMLSYIFVHHLGYSIQGVAIGTVISQYLGLLIGILLIKKKHHISILSTSFFKRKAGVDWKEFIGVNKNIFIRTLCLIFVMSFFKVKAANIDPIIGAANILLLEFITLSAYGIDGFAFAAESISGKYFGKREKSLFLKSVSVSFKWGIGFALIVSVIFFFVGKNILMVLTNKEDIINAALPYLPWLIIAPFINSIAFIWDGIYIGTTASKEMRNTMLLSTLLVFLPCFWGFSSIFSNHGIWLAFTLFMLSRGVFQTFLFRNRILSKIH